MKSDQLPLVHLLSDIQKEVHDSDNFKFGSFGYLTVNGSKCWIEGDTYLYDEFNNKGLRNKFNIRSYPQEPNEVDIWLDVKEEIKIFEEVYYMHSITKFQQHSSTILEIIEYCKKALKLDKKVFWFFC